jgi:phosphatidylglycerol:prolipoprotein diacylglycerol transferase
VKVAILHLGPIELHWYGIIVALALIAGLFVAVAMARLRRERVDPLAALLLLGLLTGLLGARLWYVAFNRDFYAPNPTQVFAIWQGGLAIQGGILGAVLATLIYTWSTEVSFWTWADICAPGMILGQAIGRAGDLLNNQAFGQPTNGPFYVVIPPENRPLAYPDVSHFQPTAAYEGLWDVAVFLVLIGITLVQRRDFRVLPAGVVFLAYLILYSAGRMVLEGMRIDSLYVGNVRVGQVAAILCIAVAALCYVLRLTHQEEQEPEVPVIVQGQPSAAYLAAASRAAQPRTSPTAPQQLPWPPSYSGGSLPFDSEQSTTAVRPPNLPLPLPGGTRQPGESA